MLVEMLSAFKRRAALTSAVLWGPLPPSLSSAPQKALELSEEEERLRVLRSKASPSPTLTFRGTPPYFPPQLSRAPPAPTDSFPPFARSDNHQHGYHPRPAISTHHIHLTRGDRRPRFRQSQRRMSRGRCGWRCGFPTALERTAASGARIPSRRVHLPKALV